jgi:AsmA protein
VTGAGVYYRRGRFVRIAKWVGICLAVVIAVVFSLPFLINVDQFRPTLQSDLSAALGRDVKLGNLHLKVFGGEVTADDLSVAEDPAFGTPAFIQAKSLHVGVELWPFLVSRHLIVTDLNIDQPEIALVQAPTGDWNFSTLGAKLKPASASEPATSGARMPLNLSVQLVKITNGRLTLRRTVGHWKPLVLEQVNLQLRDFSSATAFPFSLSALVRGGGALKLDGKAGPLNPADSAMTPVTVNLNLTGLDLARSGMNDFAPDLSGLISFNGKADSDGVHMQMTGTLQAEHLKVAKNGSPAARPVELDFSVQHDLRTHAGTVSQGDVHIGKALVHLTGSYVEQGESMVLSMKLAGPEMPLPELEAMLPSVGVVLPAGASLKGGTATVELSMNGPADRAVTAGSLSLNNTRLVGFDLSKKMSSIEKLAGIKAGPDTDIQTLSANIRSSPEGTNAQDMRLVIPAIGELTGAGTVSPSNELDFKMSAIVHLSGLLAVVGNKPIPFTVEGTCSQPVFKPDLKAVAEEEVKGIGGDVGKAAGGLIKGLLRDKK